MAGDEKGEQAKHLTRSDIQEQLLLEEKENAKADAAHATKSGNRHSSQDLTCMWWWECDHNSLSHNILVEGFLGSKENCLRLTFSICLLLEHWGKLCKMSVISLNDFQSNLNFMTFILYFCNLSKEQE